MSDTVIWSCPSCRDKDAEIERLKARVAELEAQLSHTSEIARGAVDFLSDDWDDWTEDMAGAMV